MSIKVAVTGARGRVGTMIVEEILRSDDLELVAGFDLVGAGEPLGRGVGLSGASHLTEVLQKTEPDVLIDFTVAKAAVENVSVASSLGIDLVVGTTGFTEDHWKEMRSAIDGNVSAVITPNFSIGVNTFWRLIEVAARAFQGYDVEVIEAHHRLKKDSPSGTAVAAVNILKGATGIDEVVYGRKGISERGSEIGVHAVRAGDIVGDHTVLFAGPGERLEIKHQAHSRQAFVTGAIMAARWVVGAPPGIYSMKDVLNKAAT